MNKLPPIELCRHCIDDTRELIPFEEGNHIEYTTSYCVTICSNNFVPKHIPPEQVIKYLKGKGI
jgi:hypothetical protein